MKKEITSTTKAWYILIGILLIIGNLASDNKIHLLDWSTPEQTGRNTFTLITTLIGVYLLYLATRKSKENE